MKSQELHSESVTQKNRLAYSVEEVSEQTTLSQVFIRKEISRGNLKARHIGRRVVILAGDLSNYLNSAATVSASEVRNV